MVIEIRRQADFDELVKKSQTHNVLIFKHSTQCPISFAAYDEFERFTDNFDDIPCGVVRVIEERAISNRIESELGVRHESPQAIVVHKGRSKWNASHWAITSEALSEAIRG